MIPNADLIIWGDCTFDISGQSDRVRDRVVRHRYEGQTIDRMTAFAPIHLPFVNFGGGMGIVDCLHNKKMLFPDLHFSVEGNPKACEISERNRELNSCKYKILNNALAYDEYVEFFSPKHDEVMIMDGGIRSAKLQSRNLAGEMVRVKGITLTDIVTRNKLDRIVLCVDVEGAEYSLVEKEWKTIVRHCDFALIEWHFSDAENDEDRKRALSCKQVLKKHMYFDAAHSSSRMSIFYRDARRSPPLTDR
jgi:FkbM family methyltransferase